MSVLFDVDLGTENDIHSRYLHIRDHESRLRQHLESEWEKFRERADPDFRQQLSKASSFESRAWEMRVRVYLMHKFGDKFVHGSPNSKGLDLCVNSSDSKKIWIECTASGEGVEPLNQVPKMPIVNRHSGPQPKAISVGDGRIELRFSNSISVKLRDQIIPNRESGRIKPNDSILIALSASNIDLCQYPMVSEIGCPRGLHPLVTMLYASDKGIYEGFAPHPNGFICGRKPYSTKVKRDAPTEGVFPTSIDTDYFVSSKYAYLSAVLFCPTNTVSRKYLNGDPVGNDFMLIDNPLATTPTPRNWLKEGIKFWIDESKSNGDRMIRRKD